MFNFIQNIQLSDLLMIAILTIVMMGLLISELFNKNNKKQIGFAIFIYFLFLIRIIIDIYVLYFSKSTNWIFYSNILLMGFSLIFFYINRKKVDSIFNYLFFICVVFFAVSTVLFQLIPSMIIFYYIYLVLLVFYNIFFYLLVLSFLTNSRHDN